jgi:hypothetical protein
MDLEIDLLARSTKGVDFVTATFEIDFEGGDKE